MSRAPSTLSMESLTDSFRRGIKKPAERAVGIEWEKIGIHAADGTAIRYTGNAGVEAIFSALVQRFGWSAELQNGRAIALHRGGTSITLEPGGQIELSGRTHARLEDNEREIRAHLAEIREISEPLGVIWLGIGAQPVSRAEQIEWVPKERYAVMRELLAGRGEQTFSMMKETASIQVSLDYTSETDAMRKLRVALGLSPVLTAIFPNSPLQEGRQSAYLSRRSFIWSQTAPERSGFPAALLRQGARFDDYAQYALDVPMLFVKRQGHWLPVRSRTFRQYLSEGYEGLEATLEDWELHLTGIFTEARLKQYVEIRSVDCQQTTTGLAVAALLKGLFYDETAFLEIEKHLRSLGEPAATAAHSRQEGLRAVVYGMPALDWARRLLDLARAGLRRSQEPGEAAYLEPLQEIVDTRRTPAEKLLACGCRNHPETIRHIIRCAQI